MPEDMGSVSDATSIYTCGNFIYFIHNDYVDKYDILENMSEKVSITKCKNFNQLILGYSAFIRNCVR